VSKDSIETKAEVWRISADVSEATPPSEQVRGKGGRVRDSPDDSDQIGRAFAEGSRVQDRPEARRDQPEERHGQLSQGVSKYFKMVTPKTGGAAMVEPIK
jgi:hypothetical protein